jgi:hypothetical protein
MPELKREQKEDLKNWEKKLRTWFTVLMVWAFLMAFSAILLAKIFGNIVWYVNAGVTAVLFIIALYVRHYKRCPNCNTRIACGYRIIAMPEKCCNCGVKFS